MLTNVFALWFSYKKFTYGKSIAQERETLANLHENMKFKNGPKDKNYKKMVEKMMEDYNRNAGFAGKEITEIKAKIREAKISKGKTTIPVPDARRFTRKAFKAAETMIKLKDDTEKAKI